MTDSKVYTGAALLGAVAGMRSMTAPALVSQLAHGGKLTVGHPAIDFLQNSTTAKASLIFAAGEAIADKLPFMPSRTKPVALLGRALTGGFAGAAVCSAKRRPVWIGAVIGAATAIGAAYGAYQLRKRAGESLHVPDPLVALAEDAIVASLSFVIVSKLRSELQS